jgi:hypothetical protein
MAWPSRLMPPWRTFLSRSGCAGRHLGVQVLGQRRLHVHLQQEVHAAAQVQAQVHGQALIAVSQAGERDTRFSATM